MIDLIHVSDVTRSCVLHDSIISEYARECEATHLCARHDSLARMINIIHVCDMTHSCA